MDNNNKQPPKKPEGKKPKIWVLLIVTAAIVLLISTVYNAMVNGQYTKPPSQNLWLRWKPAIYLR